MSKFLFWKRNLSAFIWGVNQLLTIKIRKDTLIFPPTFKTLIFDDVINKIWWRHHKNQNVIYNFLSSSDVLQNCQVWWRLKKYFSRMRVGKFTYPRPPAKAHAKRPPWYGVKSKSMTSRNCFEFYSLFSILALWRWPTGTSVNHGKRYLSIDVSTEE